MKFKVTEAGESNWTEVDARSPSDAGEEWAAIHWRGSDGELSYELDVQEVMSGKLHAVTVDVTMDVSFSAYATKHPGVP